MYNPTVPVLFGAVLVILSVSAQIEPVVDVPVKTGGVLNETNPIVPSVNDTMTVSPNGRGPPASNLTSELSNLFGTLGKMFSGGNGTGGNPLLGNQGNNSRPRSRGPPGGMGGPGGAPAGMGGFGDLFNQMAMMFSQGGPGGPGGPSRGPLTGPPTGMQGTRSQGPGGPPGRSGGGPPQGLMKSFGGQPGGGQGGIGSLLSGLFGPQGPGGGQFPGNGMQPGGQGTRGSPRGGPPPGPSSGQPGGGQAGIGSLLNGLFSQQGPMGSPMASMMPQSNAMPQRNWNGQQAVDRPTQSWGNQQTIPQNQWGTQIQANAGNIPSSHWGPPAQNNGPSQNWGPPPQTSRPNSMPAQWQSSSPNMQWNPPPQSNRRNSVQPQLGMPPQTNFNMRGGQQNMGGSPFGFNGAQNNPMFNGAPNTRGQMGMMNPMRPQGMGPGQGGMPGMDMSMLSGFVQGIMSRFGQTMPPVVPKPAFCKEYECPPYTVLERGPNLELRRYKSMTFAAADIPQEQYGKIKSYWILAEYILQGKNSEGLLMPLTVPILIKNDTSSGNLTRSMYFLLPYLRQSSPPIPVHRRVKVVRLPAMDVYVRPALGYLSEEQFGMQAENLRRDLGPMRTVLPDVEFTAGYDTMFKLRQRYNEIWLVSRVMGEEETLVSPLKTTVPVQRNNPINSIFLGQNGAQSLPISPKVIPDNRLYGNVPQEQIPNQLTGSENPNSRVNLRQPNAEQQSNANAPNGKYPVRNNIFGDPTRWQVPRETPSQSSNPIASPDSSPLSPTEAPARNPSPQRTFDQPPLPNPSITDTPSQPSRQRIDPLTDQSNINQGQNTRVDTAIDAPASGTNTEFKNNLSPNQDRSSMQASKNVPKQTNPEPARPPIRFVVRPGFNFF